RIATASGKPADARAALGELEKAAAQFELPLLRAAVLSAKSVLAAADGDDTCATEFLQDAMALYENAGFVHEAETARRELERRGASSASTSALTPLTNREMEVLRLIARGLSEREAADKLCISPHTAHRHLSNIRLKLNVATQAAAVAYAARTGLL